MTTSTTGGSRPLRADAARNREAILSAARTEFAESGTSASMNQIARRANVGIATLLRRFPTRGQLLAAVFEEKLEAYVSALEAGLEDADGWRGFRTFLELAFEMQARDCAFTDVLTMSVPGVPEFTEKQRRASRLLPDLVERARATGRLRADVTHQDVALLLWSISGVVQATRRSAPEAWRRVAALSFASLQTDAEELPPPPTSQQLFRSFAQERVAGARSRG